MSNEFKYDVAFSFLQQDEPLAMQLNDHLQDRVKTFIYTEQQKIVAGTDGEVTFHRVFGKEARKVVVLYRAGWGESRWTRIEQTAIRNRGHEHGYTFTVFIPLDKSPKVPNWLPAAQVWVDYNRFGLDGAAAVIEARIQDAGGQVHQETLEEHAQRTERAIAFSQRRDKFQWDEGAQAARREYGKLAPALQSCVETIKKSSSIPLAVEQVYNATYLTGLGRALGIVWKQPTTNHLGDACLDVVLFSHLPVGPGQFQFEKPHQVRSLRFKFDLLPTGVGGWISNDALRHAFSTEALAEYLTKFYLEHGRQG